MKKKVKLSKPYPFARSKEEADAGKIVCWIKLPVKGTNLGADVIYDGFTLDHLKSAICNNAWIGTTNEA